MIRCKTELDKDVMKALAKYHASKDTIIKRRKKLFHFMGSIFFVIAAVAAYNFIQGYDGTESVLSAVVSISIYILVGAALFIAAAKGMEHRLYQELKIYFSKANIKCFEYVISETGIRLIVNGKASRFGWDKIDYIKSDARYYYFGSEGKYNIISKESISSKNIDQFEKWIKNVNK